MTDDQRPTEWAGAGRRSAMRWLINGFLSLWGLGAAALGLSFLKAPPAERRPEEGQVSCGPIATLAVGEARFVRHGTEPLFVIRASETEVVALSAICTHLRCVLTWDNESGSIHCPCHAGLFDRTGNVLSGPPNRPLPRYPAEIRGGEIVARL